MCSSRQNTAPRSPACSASRYPSATSTSLPHQVQRRAARTPAAAPSIISGRFTEMADVPRVIVLEGDQTGQELLEQAIRLLDPGVCGRELELEHYDLSLDNRRRTNND